MLYKNNTISNELLLEFFLTFSKFEYALKASGYLLEQKNAKANWGGFEDEIEKIFRIDQNEKLKKACQNILDYPPKKQVVVEKSLKWESSNRGNVSDIKFLLQMVRCIRNNLFHGGKHNNKQYGLSNRTKILLDSALAIMYECLRLNPVIRDKFDHAVIIE